MAQRDERILRAVIEYMRSRGAFAPLSRFGKHEIRAEIVDLPWNPEAPKRIKYLVLYEFVHGGWKDGQSRVRSASGKHWNKGTWIDSHWAEAERVLVPHWDYDGCTPEARDAWELADNRDRLNQEARNRANPWEVRCYMHTDIDNLEVFRPDRDSEWANPNTARQAWADKHPELMGRAAP